MLDPTRQGGAAEDHPARCEQALQWSKMTPLVVMVRFDNVQIEVVGSVAIFSGRAG